MMALSVALVALENGEEPIQAPPSKSGRPRSRTIAPAALLRQVKKVENEEWTETTYPDDVERPATREQCSQMARPCPFVSCAHHLYLDVNPETGAIKLNFPHLEVWEMAETCSLDLADRGGMTLEEVGAAINVTRERARQVEARGLRRLNEAGAGQ